MGSNKKFHEISLGRVTDVFYSQYLNKGNPYEKWQEFIDECGIKHVSMDRLIITDLKKWFIAKIKYGF